MYKDTVIELYIWLNVLLKMAEMALTPLSHLHPLEQHRKHYPLPKRRARSVSKLLFYR